MTTKEYLTLIKNDPWLVDRMYMEEAIKVEDNPKLVKAAKSCLKKLNLYTKNINDFFNMVHDLIKEELEK